MWRVNWVHPFSDGNGRTSRMIAYVVLCVRLGFRLPGTNTIPEQIAADKHPYYVALEAADSAWTSGVIEVGAMEKLLSELLAVQLVALHDDATGN
jgi:Fic family protein